MSLTKLTSSLVTYKHGGTGSEPRSLGDKLRESVSVLDFGAVADGNSSTAEGTDNSPLFQAALDYCQTLGKALHIPAGTYVLRSQITTAQNNHIIGDGMYKTILIAPQTFTGDGLIKMAGPGGPPGIVEHLAILGATATGSGAGSIGLALAANASLANDVWIGGFSTQFSLSGTDCRLINCWADVSLASGVGFSISNGSNSLLDCTVFNCYVGISIYGGWTGVEPDIGIQITNCNLIQCGYSGITITNAAKNVFISNVSVHSPTIVNKFTRDFITIDTGCDNISINQLTATFGTAQSSSTTGIAVNGQPTNVSITNSTITGCNIGIDADQPVGFVVADNQLTGNKLGGFRLFGAAPSAVTITGNVARSNGNAAAFAANTSFGFWLKHDNAANTYAVSSNSALDYSGLQYYGFYVEHTNGTRQLAFTGNTSISDGVAYEYAGAGVAKIISKETNAPSTYNIVDNYVEGDWTPSVFYGATEAAYYSRGGKYTRIGRMVICHIAVYFARNTGAITITGLPFTSANFAGQPDILFGVSGRDFPASADFTGYVNKGSTTAVLNYSVTGAADSEIRAIITYFV